MAISVNIFRRSVTIDFQPRTKKGQPPHRTTGVASASSTQLRERNDHPRKAPKPAISAMAISSSGKVNAQLTQNRRVISCNSSLGSSSAVNVRGSSAIPQIGQAPGARVTISGCMGQVYSTPAAAALGCGTLEAGESERVAKPPPAICQMKYPGNHRQARGRRRGPRLQIFFRSRFKLCRASRAAEKISTAAVLGFGASRRGIHLHPANGVFLRYFLLHLLFSHLLAGFSLAPTNRIAVSYR